MEDPVTYIITIVPLAFAEIHRQNPLVPLPSLIAEADGNGHPNGKSPSAPPATKNAWLFQSNPALYDLRGALHTLNEQVWSVSRYAKEIRRGDRVYLWEAGREGGIAGVAEIAEPARLRSEPPEQLPFSRIAEAFAGERLRARLRILRIVEPVIPRQAVVSAPGLGALGVMRCSRGTNFRLSEDQWLALNSLIVGS